MSDEQKSATRPRTPLTRAPRPKRFYKGVTIVAVEAGHAIHLDGKPAKTPGGALLMLQKERLALRVAAEWEAQGGEIDATSMPVTRLVNVAIDAIDGHAVAVRADIVKYAGSDLVCYRAEEPARLVARQAQMWDPVLAFAADQLGARFSVRHGIVFKAQSDATIAAIRDAVGGVKGLELAALHSLTTLCGSALIALGVARGVLSAAQAVEAAHVDEDWNRELWGADEEALAVRAHRARDILAAGDIFLP